MSNELELAWLTPASVLLLCSSVLGDGNVKCATLFSPGCSNGFKSGRLILDCDSPRQLPLSPAVASLYIRASMELIPDEAVVAVDVVDAVKHGLVAVVGGGGGGAVSSIDGFR